MPSMLLMNLSGEPLGPALGKVRVQPDDLIFYFAVDITISVHRFFNGFCRLRIIIRATTRGVAVLAVL